MLEKIPAFIIDLDGTIALHTEEERGHFEYSKVKNDSPNYPVIKVIERILLGHSIGWPKLEPLFMSGRADENDGQVREDTRWWINRYTLIEWEYKNLFMRPEFLPDGKRDFRKDDVVKAELYHKHVEPYFDVQFAIDDRPRVLKMWHSLGIPTLAVGTPWIEF